MNVSISPAPITIPLSQVGIHDIDQVGGKNASLGEMLQHLTAKGIHVPNGFVVTVKSYEIFIEANGLNSQIQSLLEQIDLEDLKSLEEKSKAIRTLIKNATFPSILEQEIAKAYEILSAPYGLIEADVAVRSSATAEDLPDASFAGQQETFLNVVGESAVLQCIKECFASLFTARAISYRFKKFRGKKVGISVCVQKMVRTDKGASGVAFSLDPESGYKQAIVINGSYGLGEMVVQGAVKPDEFIVHKAPLRKGFFPIIEKKLGDKDMQMVYSKDRKKRVDIVPVGESARRSFCLAEEKIIQLAHWIMAIEEHYSAVHGKWCPVDVEWGLDGISGKLYILQSRPETIHSIKISEGIKIQQIATGDPKELLVEGIAVGDKIAKGRVHVVHEYGDCEKLSKTIKKGDVLVTDMTDPDWEPVMKAVSAIITNKGGRTCHAAIVARELGVPAIVGCGNATELLKDAGDVTVSCGEGEVGKVYGGHLEVTEETLNLSEVEPANTPILMNVGSPAMAFKHALLPNGGVGLARLEFIINNYIKIHPLALLHHRELGDSMLSTQIENMIAGFDDEEDYFIKKLSYGIGKIAGAFYDKPVVVRFSDFKSNEYYNLLGGSYFEPDEENPMIGWRGASRYYSEKFKQAFGMECKAIKKVREEMGLKNVIVMVPFCRTVEELIKVKAVMGEFGLEQGKDGLQVYMMAEIPSNVLLANEFAQHIDGFSIGSNDLTQLTLGIDRDSALVAGLYDEKNPAVKKMIKMLIKAAKANHVKVGLCGQGASDFPEFTAFLIKEGIDTISVTPDAVFKTMEITRKAEFSLQAAS